MDGEIKKRSRDERYRRLENIANGFYAANKIQYLLDTNLSESTDRVIKPGNIYLLKELMNIIAQYSPEKYREPLRNTCEQCNLFSDTYRELKYHLKNKDSSRGNSDNFVKTLKLIRPVSAKRHQVFIEKLIGIYEILKT